jgi:hypothetical protein
VRDPEQINADQLAFWNGQSRHIRVARQEHTVIAAPGCARSPKENGFDTGC